MEKSMIRVPSRLDDETEKYIFETMACGFAVHKAIGPGYGESIYKNAFCVELLARTIPFECEKPFVIKYRDRPVGTHRLDLIVRGRVVVELKAVKMLKRVHEAQVLAYLKASRLPVALLMNFGGATLKEGLKRIVL
jgi:GxxExxY protein